MKQVVAIFQGVNCYFGCSIPDSGCSGSNSRVASKYDYLFGYKHLSFPDPDAAEYAHTGRAIIHPSPHQHVFFFNWKTWNVVKPAIPFP